MCAIRAPDVMVADTRSARGRGVFAARDFHAGELIEASPIVRIDAEYGQLPAELQRMVFAMRGSGGRAHALALGYGCLYNGANPACMRFEVDSDAGVVRFLAVRDIRRGEELTINYSAADGGPASEGDDWFVDHGIVPVFDSRK